MRFIKFPTTPHIETPPGGLVRGDKLVDEAVRHRLLSETVTVEEKVDGANVGIWFDDDDQPRLQSRGELIGPSAHPQFNPLKAWVAARRYRLNEVLAKRYIFFGEWCYARHTVFYDKLPDYFLGFDVFDRKQDCFLSTNRRDTLLEPLEIEMIPKLYEGVLGDINKLHVLLDTSMVGSQPMEGVYIRLDKDACLVLRAKYVRKSFLQPDEIHWSRREIEPNRLIHARNRVFGPAESVTS